MARQQRQDEPQTLVLRVIRVAELLAAGGRETATRQRTAGASAKPQQRRSEVR
jgi:hypothetical protein